MAIIFLSVQVVHANPSYFITKPSASATTTAEAYMTPGVATSTLTFDLLSNTAASVDTAALLTCFNASSTATVLTTNFEYSQDNSTWYGSALTTLATSTAVMVVSTNSNQWTFASTTVGGGNAEGLLGYSCKILSVPTPTRYVRAIQSVTGNNGFVQSTFIAKQQNN